MSTENIETTEELETAMQPEEAERRRADEVAALVAGVRQDAEDRAIDILRSALQQVKSQPEPESVRVAKTAAVSPPKEETRHAFGAGRTNPASLSDYRYQALPEWQREIRSPELDYQTARWFRALAQRDHTTLREMRATLTEGESTGGAPFDGTAGELLPLPIANMIQAAMYRRARMRQWCSTYTTRGASLRIPIQDGLSTSAWVAESGAASQGEPTYQSNVSLVLQKLMNRSKMSNELLEDEAFGVTNWLVSDVSMSMAAKEDQALYQDGAGSGSNEPVGFEVSETPAATAPRYNTGPDYAAIVALFYSLPEAERDGAIFSGPDTVAEYLSALTDMQGRPIFREQNAAGGIIGDALANGQTGTVLGKPFVNMPGAENRTTTPLDDGVNRLYFWNPRRSYAILEKGDIRVAASTDADDAFSKDETHFRFTRRVDGNVIGNFRSDLQYQFIGGLDLS